MEKPNKERMLVQIIRELGEELGIAVDPLCYNWLIRLSRNGTVRHIMGYDWELNSAAAQLIAKDKSACYETLLMQGVPVVEHILFLSPQFQNYIGKNGSWASILAYAEKNNYALVCKSNTGTGGNEVFKIEGQLQLETAVHLLFAKYRGICLCPFYRIESEYRVIVLNGSVQAIYAKQKPQVGGNGKSTVAELIGEKYGSATAAGLELVETDLFRVLPAGETMELGWKHNLGKGAKPVAVTDEGLKQSLGSLALRAAKTINIGFASVDIIACDQGLLVMEINSGVMMENFAQESAENYDTAKTIYRNALVEMMR